MKMLVFGFLFWVAESVFWGNNIRPSCRAEEMCDGFVGLMMLVGYIQIKIKSEVKKGVLEMTDGTNFAVCGDCDHWEDSFADDPGICRCQASLYFQKRRVAGAVRCDCHPTMQETDEI